MVDEHPDNFFYEEWVSFCPGEHEGPNTFRQRFDLEEVGDELPTLSVFERLQVCRDERLAEITTPLRNDAPAVRLTIGTSHHDDYRSRTLDSFEQTRQELGRGGIGPMDVFAHDNERRAGGCDCCDEIAQGCCVLAV